jgi:hypothetical protein
MATRGKDDVLVGQGIVGDEVALDDSMDETEFSPDELREFLSADLLEVQADPHFKERLRMRLWALLKSRQTPEG